MSKILLFSDIHIHNHKQSHQRLLDCLKTLEWVFTTARERHIKDVLFLGDLFQDRQRIQVYAYHETYQIIKRFPDINIFLLLGNHDLWYFDKTDISSIFPLGGLAHVEVIGEPCTKNIAGLNFDFIPFTHNPLEAISKFNKKSPVLCAHIAIDGAFLNINRQTKSEVSVEFENEMVPVDYNAFKEWKRVFLGHYHGAQKLDNVEYIGSPLELNFSEAHHPKHICILDTEDLTTEYIENTFSPKHIITTPDKVFEHNLNKNFVRVDIHDLQNTDTVELANKLKSMGAIVELRDCKKIEKLQEKDKTKFSLAEGDLLERWVEATECGDMDKKMLLNLGKEICLEQ